MCKLAACTIGNAIIRAPASSYAIDNTSNAIDYEQERKLAACTTDNTTMRAPASSYAIDNSAIASAGNMPFNQRHHYRAPASSYAIDNTSNAIDYEQERQLAACTIGNAIIRAPASSYTDNAIMRAPASSYTVKSTSARASACNMPFNQRHHYRAPASSYAIDNSARASACNMPCHRQRNRLRHHECASLQHAPPTTPATP